MKLYDIPDFEGLYSITKCGKVYSNKRKIYKKQALDKDGYPYTSLSKCGIKKNKKIHRLVALTFLKNPKNYPMVNHIDGNKENNHVSNLEWCDQSHNEKHAHIAGLKNHKGEKHPSNKLTKEQVLEIRRLYKTGNYSHQKLANIFGICRRQIGRIVNKKRWTHI